MIRLTIKQLIHPDVAKRRADNIVSGAKATFFVLRVKVPLATDKEKGTVERVKKGVKNPARSVVSPEILVAFFFFLFFVRTVGS